MALLINKKKGISSEGERENRQHPVSGFFRPVIQKSPHHHHQPIDRKVSHNWNSGKIFCWPWTELTSAFILLYVLSNEVLIIDAAVSASCNILLHHHHPTPLVHHIISTGRRREKQLIGGILLPPPS